jgi:hypothetical protein
MATAPWSGATPVSDFYTPAATKLKNQTTQRRKKDV